MNAVGPVGQFLKTLDQWSSAASDELAFSPRNYGVITDGGNFGDGLAHPASANGFSTLGQLQTVYAFATALDNDIAWLMIQAALNAACLANGGVVRLPPGSFVLSGPGLSWNNVNVALVGSGPTTSILLCQNCSTAGKPGVSLLGAISSARNKVLIADVGFCAFNSGIVNGGGGSGSTRFGVADTTMFIAGSVGLLISQVWGARFRGLAFFNFDITTSYVSNSWVISFESCWFFNNNKGICINLGAVNAFERMVWINCVSGGNNYGAWINFTSSLTPGGAGQGADAYFIGCSFDYNIVYQIYYLGGAALLTGDIDDLFNTVDLSGCHIETSANCSGTANPPIFNDGVLSLRGCYGYMGGAYPPGWITGTKYCCTTVQACHVPGGFPVMPIFFASVYTNNANRVRGGGNTQRTNFSGDVILFTTPNGSVMDLPSDATQQNIVTATSVKTTLAMQRHPQILTANVAGALELYVDTVANHMIGVMLDYITAGTGLWTITPDSGVTLTSTGTTNTFGGSPGKRVKLLKTAANTWLAMGDMI